MRLRKECEHGRWDAHYGATSFIEPCPGGEFLPEGALVIEKVEGEWPAAVINELADIIGVKAMRRYLDALASQVGESE